MPEFRMTILGILVLARSLDEAGHPASACLGALIVVLGWVGKETPVPCTGTTFLKCYLNVTKGNAAAAGHGGLGGVNPAQQQQAPLMAWGALPPHERSSSK